MSNFFPEEWLEELRTKNDIVDVISAYVKLKSSNRNYLGLCPFHNEKTPSFHVNSEKQFFYCFGCQTGGNVFHFIMNIEKLSFVDAVKFLADRSHTPLPEFEHTKDYAKERKLRDRLYEASRLAARYFHDQLYTARGKHALNYLYSRGISDATIRKFGLGYAPSEWEGLTRFLLDKGHTMEELIQAGLVIESNEKKYDRFRNRVMFPIINLYGKVIGFGGRVMDQSLPKYLNSPETTIFNKSRNLYALNYIRKGKSSDKILIVEGYMDVISLHQRGIVNAVASLGTSLTQEQARLLKRYSNEVLIAYDGDSAGQKATLRGLDILSREGCKIKVMTFPEGMDPDEFIRKNGTEQFNEQIDHSLSLVEYKMKLLKEQLDMATQEGRTQYAIQCARIISQVENPVEREMFVKKLQVETGFNLETLKEQVGKDIVAQSDLKFDRNRIGNNRYNMSRKPVKSTIAAHVKAEQSLLCLMVRETENIRRHLNDLTEDDFSLSIHKKLFIELAKSMNHKDDIQIGEIMSGFQQEGEINKISEIFSLELEYDNIDKFIHDCKEEINRFKIENKIKQLQEELTQNHIDKGRRIEITMEIQTLNMEYQKMRKS